MNWTSHRSTKTLARCVVLFFIWHIFCKIYIRIAENVGAGQRLLAWDVPQSELIHIPEHWLSYPEPEMSLHLLLGLLYVFFFVMAIVGNGLVLWVFSALVTHQFYNIIIIIVNFSVRKA